MAEESDVRVVLESSCRGFCPAAIITREPTVLCQGRFTEVADETVTIELFSVPDGAVIWPLGVGSVSFHQGNLGRMFMTRIRDYQASASLLVLELPLSIATADVRRAARIPVMPGSRLRVKVRASGQAFWPRPVNISLGGILLQFTPELDPDLALESAVGLQLSIEDGEQVSLTGVVRRRRDHDYALFFTEVLERRTPEVDRLGGIVDVLQRTWLSQKAAMQKGR
ncbi:MAG: PilZ domain-containing protein [Deltaproteobacteria bacterium]|nr:PilZ domain-containing protein [Deltaproteobacteria bacterium]